MNQTSFYNIQRTLVVPVINKHFSDNIAQAREESRGKYEAILGDGRFDSPGKCAISIVLIPVYPPLLKRLLPVQRSKPLKGKALLR